MRLESKIINQEINNGDVIFNFIVKRNSIIFLFLSLLVFVLFALDLVSGDSALSVGQVWNVFTGNETDMTTRNIVLSIRLVRVIVAVLIGVALSISGLQMQTVFRNPLADPYLLGVSSGSGLGVAFFILGAPLLGLAHSGFWQSVGIVGAGWGGAVMVLLLIAIISRYVKNILGVLIMGVMIGYIAGAIIQILQYLSSAEQLKMFFLWSMGSLGHVICVGVILSIYCIKALNLLLLGESYAQTMGLNIRRARTLIFVSTTLLTGTVTAFCGPVGFLGLAVPHVARMLFNDADHRTLLPGSILLGVVAMLICDIIAKTLVLPVNCITALLGIPVIIWVVYKNLRPA